MSETGEPTDSNDKAAFVWSDLPPKAKAWPERLVPLMERPGAWAMFPNMSHASRPNAFPAGTTKEDWEFTSRTTEGVQRLYVRYVGPLLKD